MNASAPPPALTHDFRPALPPFHAGMPHQAPVCPFPGDQPLPAPYQATALRGVPHLCVPGVPVRYRNAPIFPLH